MTIETTDDWPQPGRSAALVWADGRTTVRVADQADGTLVGTVSTRTALPSPGTPIQLEWSDDRGLYRRDASVAAVVRGAVQLESGGPTDHIQRRNFFRAQTALGATVAVHGTQTPAVAVDLSEGGMRLRVDGATDALASSVVTSVVVDDGEPAVIHGTVVRQQQRATNTELGIAFDELPEPVGEQIRRAVFNAQVDARKEGRRR
jgi:hypothetical protein